MSILEELYMVAARWKLGHLRGEDLPAIAARALELGVDSPALAALAASSRPTLRDAESLLSEGLRDLEIPEPDPETAGMLLARHYAAAIVAGELTPYEGARRIWHEVYDVLEGPERLFPFKGAASEIEDYEFVRDGSTEAYDGAIAECRETILRLARELLS